MEQIEAEKFEIQLRLKDKLAKDQFDIYSDFNTENLMDLKDFYTTQERIDKWKNKLIEKIKKCKNPFNIDILYYEETSKVPKDEVIMAPQKFIDRTKNAPLNKIYCVTEKQYNYHNGYDRYDSFYVLYDKNKLSKISYEDFYDILKRHGYKGKKKWEKEYPHNHMIIDYSDGYVDFDEYNMEKIKQLFNIDEKD